MRTTAADILAATLRNKQVRVGFDKKWRECQDVVAVRARLKVVYTDGDTRFITPGTRIEVKDEGNGLPPAR